MCLRLLLLVALCVSRIASAQQSDATAEAKRHYELGMARFNLREFKAAIPEFEAAYRVVPDPVFLFNLGQAYRLDAQPEQALYFYRAYLRARPDAPNRAEVDGRIEDLKALVATRPKPAVPLTAKPDESAPANHATRATVERAVPPPPPRVSSAIDARAAGPGREDRGMRTKTIAGFTLIGVGVASLGAAIGLQVVASQAADTLNQPKPDQLYDSALDSRGQAYQSAGIALFAVGGAAVVVGGVLAIVGRRQAHKGMYAAANY
jgi:tetratricopeptide (TPR) repeat protein